VRAAADRGITLQLPAPVVAVLHLDPAALARQVRFVQAFRDDTFELVLADRLPERISVIERFRCPPPRLVEPKAMEEPSTLLVRRYGRR
jgi:hypothetical protein